MSEITLLVTNSQIESLMRLTRKDFPKESCSLLLGRISNNNYHVKEIKKMENVANSEYSFQMHPDELMKAYQWASYKALNVIGIYHSHLNGSRPSETDLLYMEINPVIWLIYEFSGSTYKAFILMRENLEEVKIKIFKE